jgi:hypothetical protein
MRARADARADRHYAGPEGAVKRAGYRPCGMITQTCESCGREFGCGARDDDCWCRRAELSTDSTAILREHFERCLCPDCLEVAARGGVRQRP